jgi:hypothetical protein
MVSSEQLNRRQRRTLSAIFEQPDRADIPWNDIERLLAALNAEITEGEGSRVRVALGGARAVFHRPHPERITGKPTVRSVRRFLEAAGVRP